MIPFFDYTMSKCVQEQRLDMCRPKRLQRMKWRYRACCRVGEWLIALGKRLTAVARFPVAPPSDLEPA